MGFKRPVFLQVTSGLHTFMVLIRGCDFLFLIHPCTSLLGKGRLGGSRLSGPPKLWLVLAPHAPLPTSSSLKLLRQLLYISIDSATIFFCHQGRERKGNLASSQDRRDSVPLSPWPRALAHRVRTLRAVSQG